MSSGTGPYAELEALIQERHSGKQLNLALRTRALSALSGGNRSNFRGRGIDFEEVREYQAGDDIRTIDWRVTARTGTAHTKIFREERERPVLVVTDQRNGMFFGSRTCFKSVLAAHCAALLCWAALEQGDRIGGLVFNDNEHREVRPRRNRSAALSYLHQLSELNQQLPMSHTADTPQQQFADTVSELRRIARPGSAVLIISDFHGALEPRAMEHLHQLSRHTEITALHCSDPLEKNLPDQGRYRVTDGNLKVDLNTADSSIRSAFSSRYDQQLEALQENLGKLGIPLVPLSTSAPALDALLPYFSAARQRKVRA